MSRPKQFDRERALRQALDVFWDKGYEATSTDDLLSAMGIARQSLYDTFGDKRRIYVEALRVYVESNYVETARLLSEGDSPLAALQALMLRIAGEPPQARSRGCMGIKSINERSAVDPDVLALNRESTLKFERVFERCVLAAIAKGELPADTDARAAGRMLLTVNNGMKVNAMAGSTPKELQDVVRLALRSLTRH